MLIRDNYTIYYISCIYKFMYSMYNISRVDYYSAFSNIWIQMLRVSNFVLLFSFLLLYYLKEYILEKEIYLIKILSIVMKFREIVNQYTGCTKGL